MPKLVLFSKCLNVGSDASVFTGSFEVLLRTLGLVLVFVEFLWYLHEFERSCGHLVHCYLTGLMIFFTLTIIVDSLIVGVSMRGTVISDGPRKSISMYLYIRLDAELLWTIYGTASVVLHIPVCESKPCVYWIACAAVAGGWFTTVIHQSIELALLL